MAMGKSGGMMGGLAERAASMGSEDELEPMGAPGEEAAPDLDGEDFAASIAEALPDLSPEQVDALGAAIDARIRMMTGGGGGSY
jgi:hypothetical protein